LRSLPNHWPFGVILVCVLSLVGCKQSSSTSSTNSSNQPATTQSMPASAPQELSIAAAADLRYALEDVAAEFRKVHPDVDVKITYGSSGNFFSQISNHAPFDLFLSADASYPTKLVAQGEGGKGSEFTYAVGRIVLWAPNGSKFNPAKRKMQALLDPALKKVAIANPDHAPYGRAAEAALKKYKLWDKLQPKLVQAGNISETATMAQSGATDVGILALSLALAPQMKNAGTYFEIPPENYPTINQVGVILAYAKNPAGARMFKQFLLGPEARTILKRYGFGIPADK
jgi:molybdate transport system substrate-binding protein